MIKVTEKMWNWWGIICGVGAIALSAAGIFSGFCQSFSGFFMGGALVWILYEAVPKLRKVKK